MDLYEETKYIMDKYNVIPNKKLGQNFLICEETLNKIADNVNKNDTVIEIGPRIRNTYSYIIRKSKKSYCN